MDKPLVIKLKETGFCYGVTRAIKIVTDTVANDSIKKPIYLLGNLVHNKHISEYLKKLGVIVIDGDNRLEMLDYVPNHSTVIFSAHGVSDKVREKAFLKNLTIIDATCPYVEATFKLVSEACKDNDILFIGKHNHPETEAVLELSKRAHLVNPNNIYLEGLDKNHIKVAHQTTMSCYDIKNLFSEILKVYPNARLLDMICRVTEKRQTELGNIDNLDFEVPALIIVVGDKSSNNSTKLYELAKRSKKCDSLFIESIAEINLSQVRIYKTIIVASGTSTPISLINEICDVLNNLHNIDTDFVESIIASDNLI